MLLCTMYTRDTPYQEIAKECVSEFAACGVNVHAVPYESYGDWAANCLYASSAVKQAWGDRKEPIVFLDADVRPNPKFDSAVIQAELRSIECWLKGEDAVVCEARPGQETYQWISLGVCGFACHDHGQALFELWDEICVNALDYFKEHGKHIGRNVQKTAGQYILADILIDGEWKCHFLKDGYGSRDCNMLSPFWHSPASIKHKALINGSG